MTLSQKHLNDVCMLNSSNISKTCKYLKNDELDGEKWYCQKLQSETRTRIDKFINNLEKRNLKDFPMGDNCEGYPLLKHIIQGYDVIS